MGWKGVEVNEEVLKHIGDEVEEGGRKAHAGLATVCILHYHRSTAV